MWQALNALITAYLVNILKAFKAKARKEIIQEIFWPLALAQLDYVQSFGVLCVICAMLNVFLFFSTNWIALILKNKIPKIDFLNTILAL